jgi:hypothetical protein
MIGNSAPTLFMAHPPASQRGQHGEEQGALRRAWDADTVEEWIARHPVVCVTTALFLGAMVGWLIKRR